MLRIPVRSGGPWVKYSRARPYSSSSFIRSTFVDYFKENHGHKVIRSSSVIPLFDPTVPFVNAGMNQFKGVFLGNVQPPCPRAVNSQKCVRVGGKHNDLDVVGTDGHHHTFFEMLGNWSFGDYYKKEACQMAWDLLLGPYRLKPENLVVTYFAGDIPMGLTEDRECRDIWRAIGVPSDRLRPLGAIDNFWEMGVTGPCGPCTEIHHVNADGSLTEIWNLVFIQCNREADGSISPLRTQHVDTGMGLERMAALMQGTRSNYDTDLFQPLLLAMQQSSKREPYSGKFGPDAIVDCAYRRLADHARMISVCLADSAYPATSLNLKQIMRKTFKISSDLLECKSGMLAHLYDVVAESLGDTYPELQTEEKAAKLIIAHEEDSYRKMRATLAARWGELVRTYPEVEILGDVELAGFALGYREFKETMAKVNTTVIPGEVIFKLHSTHGFQEDVIDRIAQLNNFELDREGFNELILEHKSRHKAAFKEQTDKKAVTFDEAIEKLNRIGINKTNDQYKYDYEVKENKLVFAPLKTKLVALLNKDAEWLDFSEPCENKPYYIVTKDTNFYCEEGGQTADTGIIKISKNIEMSVETVFKIRDLIFHKGYFKISKIKSNYVKSNSDVTLQIDEERRLNTMRNHTGVHLLHAAVRKALPNSVVCQNGSSVTDKGFHLHLSVYGEKLSPEVLLEAQDLVRKTIQSNAPIQTSTLDSVQLSTMKDVCSLPGETYPEVGLRLVHTTTEHLVSKELCCGTHLPATGYVGDFCVTLVKGAGGNSPTVHALTGDKAKEARELFCRADKLQHVGAIIEPGRMRQEATAIRQQLNALCGAGGAPGGDHATCLAVLDKLLNTTRDNDDLSLQSLAEAEVRDLYLQTQASGRRFLVHFLRCSYLMRAAPLVSALDICENSPAMLMGCANGIIQVACKIPKSHVTAEFTAERWLSCALSVFEAEMSPPRPGQAAHTYAEMVGTKVSLITCEQLVQDAMRAAVRYADGHTRGRGSAREGDNTKHGDDCVDRRSN